MDVAVVILNYNGKAHLEKFLPSVVSNSHGLRIIVADNNSNDDSIAFLMGSYPEVEVISLDENYGFAGGYNKALDLVKSDIYILLNSDVETPAGWHIAPVEVLKQNDNIVAVQPKIKSFLDKSRFEHAGAAGGFIDRLGYPFCRGRIFTENEKDEGQYDESCDIFWASGACLFIKADAFHEAGGFDADFFAHMEEIDLCWRLKNLGYRIRYCGESEVFHLGGGTLPYSSPRKTYLNFRNNLFLLTKNLPSQILDSLLLKRLVFDGLAGMKFFFGAEASQLKALWKAHRDFFSQKKLMLQKRKGENQRFDFDEIYPKSIVKSFYLRKLTRFSELDFPVNEDRQVHPVGTSQVQGH